MTDPILKKLRADAVSELNAARSMADKAKFKLGVLDEVIATHERNLMHLPDSVWPAPSRPAPPMPECKPYEVYPIDCRTLYGYPIQRAQVCRHDSVDTTLLGWRCRACGASL